MTPPCLVFMKSLFFSWPKWAYIAINVCVYVKVSVYCDFCKRKNVGTYVVIFKKIILVFLFLLQISVFQEFLVSILAQFIRACQQKAVHKSLYSFTHKIPFPLKWRLRSGQNREQHACICALTPNFFRCRTAGHGGRPSRKCQRPHFSSWYLPHLEGGDGNGLQGAIGGDNSRWILLKKEKNLHIYPRFAWQVSAPPCREERLCRSRRAASGLF